MNLSDSQPPKLNNKLTPPQAAGYSGSQDQIRTPKGAGNATQNRLNLFDCQQSIRLESSQILLKVGVMVAGELEGGILK